MVNPLTLRGLPEPIHTELAALSGRLLPAPANVSATWGDGGYRNAMDDARRSLPREAVLYDVRADLASLQILSVYYQRCVVLDAAVALPLEAAAPAPAPQSEVQQPTAAP